MITLYIEDHLMDLAEDFQFSQSFSLINYDNPTNITYSFTKSVNLPLTDNNRKVFSLYSQSQFISVENVEELHFNPNKVLKVRVYDNANLILDGFFKFSKTVYSSEDKSVEGTISENTVNVLHTLQQLNLNTPVNDNLQQDSSSSTTLDEQLFVKKYTPKIDKTLVYDNWNYDSKYTEAWNSTQKLYVATTKPTGKTRSLTPKSIHDILGFALMTRGLYTDFDSKKNWGGANFMTMPVDKSENSLDHNAGWMPVAGQEGKYYVQECRSYYQRPYLYVSALFHFFKEMLTQYGYNLFLDPSFFNLNNPYYYDLVVLGNPLYSSKGVRVNQYSSVVLNNQTQLDPRTVSINSSILTDGFTLTPNKDNYIQDVKDNRFINTNTVGQTPVTLTGTFQIQMSLSGAIKQLYTVGDNYINLYIADSNNRCISNQIQLSPKNNQFNPDLKINQNTPVSALSDSSVLIPPIELSFNINLESDTGLQLVVEVGENTHTISISPSTKTAFPIYGVQPGNINIRSTFSNISIVRTYTDNIRSNSVFTLGSILGENFNITTFILNFCKLFRLFIRTENTTVKILTPNFFFKNSELIDIQNRVDRSVWELSPGGVPYKNILFSHKNSEDINTTSYLNNTGIQYGDKQLITEYAFNNDTLTLFDKFGVFMEGIYPYSVFDYQYVGNTWAVKNQSVQDSIYIMPQLYTREGSDVSISPTLCFIKHNVPVRSLYGQVINRTDAYPTTFTIQITDDSTGEIASNSYNWNGNKNGKFTYQFDTVSNFITKDNIVYSILFEKPLYTNALNGDLINNARYIYPEIWKTYIEDLYIGKDKEVAGTPQILKTRLHITPSDLTQTNIYSLDGSHWLLNKITDYNPNLDTFTTVELLKIQNLDNYKYNILPQAVGNYIQVDLEELHFSYLEQTFSLTVYTDYTTINLDFPQSNLTLLDTQTHSGCTQYVFKLTQNTSETEQRFTITFKAGKKTSTCIVYQEGSPTQDPSATLYATQYTAYLDGLNASNTADNNIIYNSGGTLIVEDIEDLDIEVPRASRLSTNRNLIITNLKNKNDSIYFNISLKQDGTIIRNLVFKVITHLKRKGLKT